MRVLGSEMEGRGTTRYNGLWISGMWIVLAQADFLLGFNFETCTLDLLKVTFTNGQCTIMVKMQSQGLVILNQGPFWLQSLGSRNLWSTF